jgi:hypothetical protein
MDFKNIMGKRYYVRDSPKNIPEKRINHIKENEGITAII